jgi:hypothetical protein
MKALLLIVATCALCGCETAPAPYDSFDDADYVAPRARASSALLDPRTYMDKDDANIQKMMSSRLFQ